MMLKRAIDLRQAIEMFSDDDIMLKEMFNRLRMETMTGNCFFPKAFISSYTFLIKVYVHFLKCYSTHLCGFT